MRVACIGEVMIEMSLDGDVANLGVAGDTLNTAVYMKRSAPELDIDYITRLGTDPFSERIADFISSELIGTENIGVVPDAVPGLYAITLSESGERSFTYWRSASAARSLFDDADFGFLNDYDLIYLSGISMAILPHMVRLQLIDFLRDFPGKVAFDSNYRPQLWSQDNAQEVTSKLWSFCDIALPSIDDEMALFNETADQVEARCLGLPGVGALKRGQRGPLAIGSDVSQDYTTAPRVVDTTAAGDSFNGAYLAALLTGSSQAEALLFGHSVASIVIGERGAIIPKGCLPRRPHQ